MDKIKQAQKKAKEAEAKFSKLIREYITKHHGSESDFGVFADMLGYGRLTNTMLASNLPLRTKAIHFLGQALERLRQEDENLNFQFWTLLHTRGNMSDRTPKIDLKFLHSQADKTFRKLKLGSVQVVELQGLGNYPRKGNGRTIMGHIHAVTWTTADFDIGTATAELRKSKLWQNDLGADAIDIKHVSAQPGELTYLAYYLLKPPYEAKMLEERDCGPRLKGTEKAYRPEFAARILEGLSQIDLRELVRSTNGGKSVRKDWLRRTTFWHRSRQHWVNGFVPLIAYHDLWDRFRNKKRRREYKPYEIIR